jgi:hypothetical protein
MDAAGSVYAALAHYGLLLKQDKVIPSVVGLVTGESLRTSWWSHPKSHLIFRTLAELSDHPDVTFAKLLAGKDTLIHSRLWPALLTVGSARAAWQLQGLSAPAAALLAQIDRSAGGVHATGAACKEIQARLLAAAREIHGADGRHEMVVEPWRTWSGRTSCSALTSLDEARQVLEQAAAKLGAPIGWLPWRTRRSDSLRN